MDKDKIKSALDAFQKDNPLQAKEILTKEIANAKNEYLKQKLNLKKDI